MKNSLPLVESNEVELKVKLITTGRMEYIALGIALSKLFPDTDFEAITLNEGPLGDPQFRSFTSSPPTKLLQPPPDIDSEVDEIIRHAAAEAGLKDVDGVLILEDLELANAEAPDIITRVVRAAADKHLRGLRPTSRDRAAANLRDKVSFHLAAPMTEAWILADPKGPTNAGANADHLPAQVASNPNFEDFRVGDVAYLSDDGAACIKWRTLIEPKRTKNCPPWLKENRSAHPKHYLQWLCRCPAENNCTQYKETKQGAAALAELDWAAVLARGNDLPYLRSMISDLCDLHGKPSPVPAGPEANLTCRSTALAGRLLRNI